MPTVLLLGAAANMAVAIASKFASAGYDIQLAARNVSRLEPLRSDLGIRYGVACTLHEFDALDFSGLAAFFDSLNPVPDVTICVFGLLGDQERAMRDWAECERILHVNYSGAVSI